VPSLSRDFHVEMALSFGGGLSMICLKRALAYSANCVLIPKQKWTLPPTGAASVTV
jgi:hypothetical protein